MNALQIPFLDLNAVHAPYRDELEATSRRVIDKGWFVMGPELTSFENEFASYCQTDHCVGVGSGLDGLVLLLRAYGIGPGDEVIVPAHTFIATWLAVSQCGATPVPADTLDGTYNLDPDAVRAEVTIRTRAVIPVHLYGQTAAMAPLMALAEQYHLVVIEDAAQAQGARYLGRRAGSLGHAAATSFYPGKNLGALGDGGAVLTSDPAIAERVRKLRNYGSSSKYHHELAGYNSRLDEMQAAFLRVKLRHLDAGNIQRQLLARRYLDGLQGLPLGLPHNLPEADPVWHLFVVRTTQRDALQAHLQSAGIATVIHYPVLPMRQPCYASHSWPAMPRGAAQAAEVLSLPIYPNMPVEHVDRVIRCISDYGALRLLG